MRIAFHTLGCKVNQYETEAMKEQFSAAGHTIVEDEDLADVYVINTCTVTHLADRKSRQYIRRQKRVNPEAVVAVTGCYAQVSPDEVSAIEGVDIVAGTGEKQNLLQYIEEFRMRSAGQAQRHVRDAATMNEYVSDGIIVSMESRTRAYIKIQEGCNRFCSYCIIPYARGPVRSRDREEILEEAQGLLAQGFKELILTGINTALYGAETAGGADRDGSRSGLAVLLAELDALPGDFRVRLSSLEPTVVRAEEVEELLGFEKLCHHLHLSAQSGADHILREMNRRYDRAEYLEIVRVLKDFDPLFGITTDLICGFPGETAEDFADSMSLVEEVGFCKVHVFPYSKRVGTPAAGMTGQIRSEVKRQRSKLLAEKADTAAKRFFDRCAGAVRRVLFEEEAEDGMITGYTDNYVKAYVPGDETMLNQFYDVKLVKPYKDGMKGEIVNG